MASLIVGKQNTIAYTFTVSGATAALTLTGETAWDWQENDIQRIYNTTTPSTFGISDTTSFTQAFVAGLPTFTWTFSNLPAGTATADVLLIYMNVTYIQLNIALLQYQKA